MQRPSPPGEGPLVLGGCAPQWRSSLRVPPFSRREPVMRSPSRPSRPARSERRRSSSAELWPSRSRRGTVTRRPSDVTTTATARRSRPWKKSKRPGSCLPANGGFAKSSRHRNGAQPSVLVQYPRSASMGNRPAHDFPGRRPPRWSRRSGDRRWGWRSARQLAMVSSERRSAPGVGIGPTRSPRRLADIKTPGRAPKPDGSMPLGHQSDHRTRRATPRRRQPSELATPDQVPWQPRRRSRHISARQVPVGLMWR